MKNYLNRKFLPYLMCVAAVLFFTADLTLSQTRRSPIKKADWQISTAPNGQGATLGIRDKYGVSGSFKTLFVVAAPNKKTFRKRASGTGDNWVYVNFPADFG